MWPSCDKPFTTGEVDLKVFRASFHHVFLDGAGREVALCMFALPNLGIPGGKHVTNPEYAQFMRLSLL